MISLGIVRKLDNLGRICIPKELRDRMDIVRGTKVKIFVDGEMIVLRFHQPEDTSPNELEKLPVTKRATHVFIRRKKQC